MQMCLTHAYTVAQQIHYARYLLVCCSVGFAKPIPSTMPNKNSNESIFRLKGVNYGLDKTVFDRIHSLATHFIRRLPKPQKSYCPVNFAHNEGHAFLRTVNVA